MQKLLRPQATFPSLDRAINIEPFTISVSHTTSNNIAANFLQSTGIECMKAPLLLLFYIPMARSNGCAARPCLRTLKVLGEVDSSAYDMYSLGQRIPSGKFMSAFMN